MAAYKISVSFLLLLFSLFSSALVAQINVPPAPQPARYMVDLANMLTPAEAQRIEDKLYGYFKTLQTQIVIVTVGSLDGYAVEAYAEALFNKWGIGDKDRKDGLLLLISKNDRKMRIEVGYGLEATITDAFAADIINNSLKPNFKNNNFYAGIDAATKNIIKKLTPNYIIPISSADSIREIQNKLTLQKLEKESNAKKQIQLEQWAAKAKRAEAIESWIAYIVWLILKIVFFAIIFFILFLIWQSWKKEKQVMKLALNHEIILGEERLAKLDKLKQTIAYHENEHVSRFVDAYYDELNNLLHSNLHYQDTDKLKQLINAGSNDMICYKHFAECYQKTCVFTNFPPHKYYPAEARRFTEANKIKMAEISALSIIRSDSGKKARTDIAATSPQVRLSAHFKNLFDALTHCPDVAQKGANIALPIVEAFEKSAFFEQLIEAQPQSEVLSNPKVDAIHDFAQKIYDFCAHCNTATKNINALAITDDTPQQVKDNFIATAQTQISDIITHFEQTAYHSTIDPNSIITELQKSEINTKKTEITLNIYQKPFELLTEKIKAFGTIENLTAKYGSTHTAPSITALTNGISSDTATAQTKFDEADHAAAFQTVVNMFNGIFSTSAYLNLYLVAIVSRSYTSSSSTSSYSSSSYTSSYSDYTPPPAYSDYSDYKPPYSDYSDYKDYSDYSDSYSDSSYGGGSSGGGGASGDW